MHCQLPTMGNRKPNDASVALTVPYCNPLFKVPAWISSANRMQEKTWAKKWHCYALFHVSFSFHIRSHVACWMRLKRSALPGQCQPCSASIQSSCRRQRLCTILYKQHTLQLKPRKLCQGGIWIPIWLVASTSKLIFVLMCWHNQERFFSYMIQISR